MEHQASAIDELFPGLLSSINAGSDHKTHWQEREGRLFNTSTNNYLYPETESPDLAHEEKIIKDWGEHVRCLQSASTELIFELLRKNTAEFKSSGFSALQELSLEHIHDSAKDFQSEWACEALSRFLAEEDMHVAASTKDHSGGLLLIYGIAHLELLANIIDQLKPRIVLVFESDLGLLAQRLSEAGAEALLGALDARTTDLLLVTDSTSDAAHLKAKARIETVNVFAQEKLFSICFRESKLFEDLSTKFDSGDTMLRDLRYLGFFTDELHMMLNASITFTQSPPRTISTNQVSAHSSHAVIVASGPSLDAQLPLLKAQRQDFDLFSCYSTLGALLKEGLTPDYHCNQERHACHLPLIGDPSAAAFTPNALLLCSANNDPRMNTLYHDVVAFFRSASCASAIFASNRNDCISGEGPQVANLALYYAILLGYRTIHLFGVDLGTADQSLCRSPGALSHSPRSLNQPVPGNLRETAWADQSLIESAEYMGWLLHGTILPDGKPIENLKVYNYSDGQMIPGTRPSDPSDFCANLQPGARGPQPIELIRSLERYDEQNARARFIGFGWRQRLRDYLATVRALAETPLNKKAHEQFLQLSERQINKLSNQILPRMMAGTLGRVWYLIMILDARMHITTGRQNEKWEAKCREILMTCIDSMEQLTLEMVAHIEDLSDVAEHTLKSTVFS
jgi:hypothetical protein